MKKALVKGEQIDVDLMEERLKALDDLKEYVGDHKDGVKEYLGIEEEVKVEQSLSSDSSD
jgi:hypothetical protein